MIQKAKKKTFFLIGLLITGFIGMIAGQNRAGYSKDTSLLISSITTHAYADATTVTTWGGGDGCGGCSGSDTGDGGGS
jgi:hypothetical protein